MSEVDICNAAASHLGQTADIASINPPDGTALASYCQTFYPIARDALLEMHSWGFSTRRAQLALLTSQASEWLYAYAVPSEAVNILAVLPYQGIDDYSVPLAAYPSVNTTVIYQPRPYVLETQSDGSQILLTDEPNAECRYTVIVTDTSQFTPLFNLTLGWFLASFLAGPVLKGDVGAAEAKRCLQMAESFLGKGSASDANQRNVKPAQATPWLAGR